MAMLGQALRYLELHTVLFSAISINYRLQGKVKASAGRPSLQMVAIRHLHRHLSAETYSLSYNLNKATEHVDQLVAFLKDLNAHVDDSGQQKIDEFLGSLGENSATKTATGTATDTAKDWSLGRPTPTEENQDTSTEADVTGSVGSNDDLDLVDEDLFRSHKSRATGFVGQNSEVQWFRNLKNKIESAERAGPANRLPYGPPGSSSEAAAQRVDASHTRQKISQLGSNPHVSHVSDSSFYLDGEDLEMDVVVNPYELPLPEVAGALFNIYVQTVHTSFPVLPTTFEVQFYRYNESVKQGRPYQVPKSWQAILNLVLAIGAQYSHLAQTEQHAHEKDHVLYMTRAVRILGLDRMVASTAVPTLPLIQATGLLSLYYLTVGQVSSAWMTIGVSLRFAVTVGLHLRNDDPSASSSKKEDLVRTWWSLHSIENLLCTLVGRPCVIASDQCTVPLPHILPGELAGHNNTGSLNDLDYQDRQGGLPTRNAFFSQVATENVSQSTFLGASAAMSIITEKALSKFYSPQTSVHSWKQIQKEIDVLSKELDEWATALPAGLRLVHSAYESRIQREQLLLSFQYHSAKVLIYRPCLCRLEQRITGQSKASADFNQKTAEACIQAAQAITTLLPDEPDLAFVYEQSPWWCIIHNIMQAIAVFLLEMSLSQAHITHCDKSMLKSTRKLVRWLECISGSNAVARRAYEIVVDIIDTDLDTQHPTALWGRRPAGGFEELQAGQQFMSEANPQIPPMFGNPFFADFDLFNPPIAGSFRHDLDDADNS
ncbi:hypothetical protein DM02DRAFT_661868 [Periconia macrospinosa]|uniref:Xylanolytic transcriptional activator regulatory domain-containing protein n=1 Tax=Periconia macrospinosa TaxID=97972 RepID=A0A2V1D7E8_9PLEO|nr:hypothetical protein DM02DRAFT_661868 [Periconia macrospinosa]